MKEATEIFHRGFSPLDVLYSLPPSAAFEILSYLDNFLDLRLISFSFMKHFDNLHENLLAQCLDDSITGIPVFLGAPKAQIKLVRRFYPTFKRYFVGDFDLHDDSTCRCTSVWRPAEVAHPFSGETVKLAEHSSGKLVGSLNAVIDFLHSRLPEKRTDLIFFLDFLVYCNATWLPTYQRSLIILLHAQREDLVIASKVMKILKIRLISHLKPHLYPEPLQKSIEELRAYDDHHGISATISIMRLRSMLLKMDEDLEFEHTFFKDERMQNFLS